MGSTVLLCRAVGIKHKVLCVKDVWGETCLQYVSSTYKYGSCHAHGPGERVHREIIV